MCWLTAILVIFLFSITALPLITFAFFWYETANGPHLEYLSALSGGRTRVWIVKALAIGIIEAVFIVLTAPLGLVRPLWRPRPDTGSTRPTIILIHGLYHNASGWTILRARLRRAGFTNVYALSYPSFMTAFDKPLARLDGFISEVANSLPGKPVILIGHSLGGLLARACVERPGGAANILAVITLGSPHKGSKLAAIGLGALAQSLRYRGPLFKKLESERSDPPCHCFSLYSPLDNMVLPGDGLRVPYAGWTEFETGPVGHVAMLFNGAVAKKIFELIDLALDQGRTA